MGRCSVHGHGQLSSSAPPHEYLCAYELGSGRCVCVCVELSLLVDFYKYSRFVNLFCLCFCIRFAPNGRVVRRTCVNFISSKVFI